MHASAGVVAGIDVGYSKKRKSSAVCRLRWDERRISWDIARYRATERERLDAYRCLLGGEELLAVALDGPIRRKFDLINSYRRAEENLTRGFQQIGKPGQSNSPVGKSLNQEANNCARTVLDVANVARSKHCVKIARNCVVEAFPTSYLGLMLSNPPAFERGRRARSDVYFETLSSNGTLERLLNDFLPGRNLENNIGSVTNHDDRAALICAITALGVLHNRYQAVGDHQNGWIILPPAEFICPWAHEILETNGRGDGSFFCPSRTH